VSNISWIVKRRVILCPLDGDMTIERAKHINDELVAMIDQGKPPVHIVFDLGSIGHVPNNLFKLREATHVISHPGLGWVMVAGIHNPLVNFLGSMVAQLGRLSRYRVMPGVEEALAHLGEIDETLAAARK
jgi:hypothetical protein